MKKNLILLWILFSARFVNGQLCPGGGTTFSNSVVFVQSWISSCATGTSCTGGIEFDNRSSCEPTTAMDACAPAPSCATPLSNNGSDIWFKFYATGTTATINVIQNVSFVAAIQAFSGGPACGSLSEIGCALAGGPSSGVTLNLSGLTANSLYYFRVFGSANSASQRTGTYCFCGSAGLRSAALPVVLTSFNASAQQNKIFLSWHTASELNNKNFEVQRSRDGNDFATIGIIAGKGTSSVPSDYSFTDVNPYDGINYYRLKQVDWDDKYEYSKIVSVKIDLGNAVSLFSSLVKEKLIIFSSINTWATLLNEQGQILHRLTLINGRNEISIGDLAGGVYFIRSENDQLLKFFVAN